MSKKTAETPFESRTFQRLDEFGTGARDLLGRQTKGFLRIWDQALKKDTQVKDLISDSIRLWAQGMDEGFELITSPLRDNDGKDRSPVTLAFVVDDVEEAVYQKSVQSPVKLPPNAQVSATDLRRLDNKAGGDIPSSKVKVTKDDAGDVLSVELVAVKDLLKPGQYSGVVYIGGPGAPRAPLVLISLFVVDSNQHKST